MNVTPILKRSIEIDRLHRNAIGAVRRRMDPIQRSFRRSQVMNVLLNRRACAVHGCEARGTERDIEPLWRAESGEPLCH